MCRATAIIEDMFRQGFVVDFHASPFADTPRYKARFNVAAPECPAGPWGHGQTAVKALIDAANKALLIQTLEAK